MKSSANSVEMTMTAITAANLLAIDSSRSPTIIGASGSLTKLLDRDSGPLNITEQVSLATGGRRDVFMGWIQESSMNFLLKLAKVLCEIQPQRTHREHRRLVFVDLGSLSIPAQRKESEDGNGNRIVWSKDLYKYQTAHIYLKAISLGSGSYAYDAIEVSGTQDVAVGTRELSIMTSAAAQEDAGFCEKTLVPGLVPVGCLTAFELETLWRKSLAEAKQTTITSFLDTLPGFSERTSAMHSFEVVPVMVPTALTPEAQTHMWRESLKVSYPGEIHSLMLSYVNSLDNDKSTITSAEPICSIM